MPRSTPFILPRHSHSPQVARLTPGFVGADMTALCQEAASLAISRIFTERSVKSSPDTMEVETAAPASFEPLTARQQEEEALRRRAQVNDSLLRAAPFAAAELNGLAITQGDFERALPLVQPSSQ